MLPTTLHINSNGIKRFTTFTQIILLEATLWLEMPFADNLCKQFRPRPGRQNIGPDLIFQDMSGRVVEPVLSNG